MATTDQKRPRESPPTAEAVAERTRAERAMLLVRAGKYRAAVAELFNLPIPEERPPALSAKTVQRLRLEREGAAYAVEQAKQVEEAQQEERFANELFRAKLATHGGVLFPGDE